MESHMQNMKWLYHVSQCDLMLPCPLKPSLPSDCVAGSLAWHSKKSQLIHQEAQLGTQRAGAGAVCGHSGFPDLQRFAAPAQHWRIQDLAKLSLPKEQRLLGFMFSPQSVQTSKEVTRTVSGTFSGREDCPLSSSCSSFFSSSFCSCLRV